jgi:hypothetical protein
MSPKMRQTGDTAVIELTGRITMGEVVEEFRDAVDAGGGGRCE